MKRFLSLACALMLAIPLAACGVTSAGLSDPGTASTVGAAIDATGAKAPAPLADTILDEQVVATLIDGADAVATGVDLMVAGGVLVSGSPTALTVKAALIELRRWLPVAAAAQKAGNAATYREALRESAEAFLAIKSALKRQ